jgi:hypothetical protein
MDVEYPFPPPGPAELIGHLLGPTIIKSVPTTLSHLRPGGRRPPPPPPPRQMLPPPGLPSPARHQGSRGLRWCSGAGAVMQCTMYQGKDGMVSIVSSVECLRIIFMITIIIFIIMINLPIRLSLHVCMHEILYLWPMFCKIPVLCVQASMYTPRQVPCPCVSQDYRPPY